MNHDRRVEEMRCDFYLFCFLKTSLVTRGEGRLWIRCGLCQLLDTECGFPAKNDTTGPIRSPRPISGSRAFWEDEMLGGH